MSSRPSRGAARLAAILDALPDGLVLVNANGTVVNANAIALDLFEAPGTALVGRGLLDLVPGFDSQLIPGSMRRPDVADSRGRTKPTRMIARRTDGSEFPVEVTSAGLDGREAYDSAGGYTGDELLMLVVRDLTGTLDTEAELARSQRQTEMILRAAAEGVVGTDTDGRVVLVNPAAAQILGFRASDLGGHQLHPLILHSRADGEPFPYNESPLADTLKSGRKHRVRGQVLWAKNGDPVSVDLTTAPVRDGDQLVGAVMTFTDRRPYEQLAERHAAELAETTERLGAELKETTERLTAELEEATGRLTAELDAATEKHEAELADKAERYSAELEAGAERYEELAGRHAQLTAVLGESLRGPLEELRAELATLAADPAGQLWPEANQILHHLAAGYSRMTTLVDNVLGYQRLDTGAERLVKAKAMLDGVVAAGVEGAVELIGPGRAQFAVHAPPIEAEVDGPRLATALAHLVADVAGVDSTGRTRPAPGGGYVDSTIVVAAAQRGDVVRIEVRGPFSGGDPVHGPIVRGIVGAHGGVLQTHEVPGAGGSAFVLELPLGEGAGTVAPPPALELPAALPAQQSAEPVAPASPRSSGGGRRRARRASTDAFLDSPVAAEDPVAARPTGRRRAPGQELIPSQDAAQEAAEGVARGASDGGTGRRRGRPSPAEAAVPVPGAAPAAEGSVVTAAESAGGRAAFGETVPPQGVPVDANGLAGPPTGRRARRAVEPARTALPELSAAPAEPGTPPGRTQAPGAADRLVPAEQGRPGHPQPGAAAQPELQPAQSTGRRARRALAAAPVEAEPAVRAPFALPPADADRPVAPGPDAAEQAAAGGPESAPPPRSDSAPQPTPPGPSTAPAQSVATGRRRAVAPRQPGDVPDTAAGTADVPAPYAADPAGPGAADATGMEGGADGGHRALGPGPGAAASGAGRQDSGSVSLPLPREMPSPRAAQPLPAEAPAPADSTQGRAFSVRTLGQGVPLAQQLTQQQSPTPPPTGSGRRRKLGNRQDAALPGPGGAAPPQMQPQPQAAPAPAPPGAGVPAPGEAPAGPAGQGPATGQPRLPADRSEGRAYAIGAPDEGAEGPEPLDGPGGAVEVANRPQPQPVDDELPPEPLDNPRRLLVWPAPDATTQQALSDRGYRPVVVHSREEVDAQIAAFPAALFVDPLTGPITRTALQSLRTAAVAAEVPVLVTAGLGQATREAAYGADPAVLLKALAPRDSEQHPPRVLLIEEHEEIALALTETLERRGMQVARADADADAVTLAGQMRPNLVVMDLMQVRRRRAGIVDWLRANGQLNRTPLVVYTSAGLDPAELPRLASGETVLFLAERSTSAEVQARLVDLLAKIGTN
ncbi:PAS domain-containing protein [Streptomyces sp. C10-9-1]|uniref:PAS domain-containing protein n=1 Tax=Streptomyces sp. C10-9-1 TaxID=1859285 RepID=UPI002111CCA9|nr:PAS domain-containing protein [Streptomyces sp. C10-9-1]MCQ6555980.1 PAS domain-containing protein [Streptomyces sp. C10-9-1]